jgi:ribonucleoside-diphosphate reductase alpha chain
MEIIKIKKRDGRIVRFDQSKITEAVWKAAQSVGGRDHELAEKISEQVVSVLNVFFKDENAIPSVEQIQDLVEKILMEKGHAKTAKAYILYRQKHKELREQKEEILGMPSDTKFSVNALKILQQRYLLKDMNGKVIESPEQMFRRVASNIAKADEKYKGFDPKESEEIFYGLMIGKDFMPNSPTLMNAGAPIQQLAACFVLPVEDSIPDIFDTVKKAAIIQQTGGGTGFNFSNLRPRGDMVASTKGVSSGPVSFMKVFDTLTSAMKQGGKRRGANMGILNVDHPDIIEFITSKEKEGEIANFNISVGLTSKFIKAVEKNQDYDLINPRTGKAVNKLNARSVFELIVTRAWTNGEPGIVFLERINADNPTPQIDKILATNPCGEQPLLPYEACNLGSINISNFCKNGEIEWERLGKTVRDAIHFLDNVIDMSDYRLLEVKKIVASNRKIGLGIMGFADLLLQMKTPYDSEQGINTAEKLMKFIRDEAKKASEKLGEQKGSFPNFAGSVYPQGGYKAMRNATVTTIAPTGTLSMIVDTSSGIEPLYAITYTKHVLDGTELFYTNRFFERDLQKSGIYSKELMRKTAKAGSIQDINEIPEELKKIYVVAADIKPEWHVRMQAAFQKYTDNAVSKTINFPTYATIDDVKKAFLLAYELGCKGLTIYRDSSRENQVLTFGTQKKEPSPPGQTQLPFDEKTESQAESPTETPKERPKKTSSIEEIIPPPISSNFRPPRED